MERKHVKDKKFLKQRQFIITSICFHFQKLHQCFMTTLCLPPVASITKVWHVSQWEDWENGSYQTHNSLKINTNFSRLSFKLYKENIKVSIF